MRSGEDECGEDESDECTPDALQLGKMFIVCGEPWIIPPLPDLFRTPKPSFAYNSPLRYCEMTPEALLIVPRQTFTTSYPRSSTTKSPAWLSSSER